MTPRGFVTTSEHIRSLDSLRGVAALMVAAYHLHISSHIRAIPLLHNSWLFVDFFFVLSGFVIAHAYGGRITNAASAVRFIVRRFGRLWPLHVSVLSALVLFQAAKVVAQIHFHAEFNNAPFAPPNTLESIPVNVLLMQSLPLHSVNNWNSPAWSISVEFYTYGIFAVSALLARVSKRPFVSFAIALAAAVGVWLLSPGFLQTIVDGVNSIPILRCVYGFFVGVAVHWFWKERRCVWINTVAEAVAIASVFVFLSLVDDKSPWTMMAPWIFGALVFVVAHEQGRLSAMLMQRPFVKLGELSYSIYMVHQLVYLFVTIGLIKVLHLPLVPDLNWPGEQTFSTSSLFVGDAFMIGILAIVVGVSAVTYCFIEVPARDYFGRLASRIRVSSPDLKPIA